MDPRYNYFLNLLWSLTVFFAFIGYGRLLTERIKCPMPSAHRWAWHAVFGIAAILALGGVLMALSLAKAGFLILLALFGALLWLKQTSNDILKEKFLSDKTDWIKDLPLWVLMAIYFLAAVAWPYQIDPNDDLLLYLTMPVRILQEGTLLEPFSYRRAGTYGGHAFLQAMMMSFGSERSGHVVDMGWSRLLLFGLTASLLADLRRSSYWLYLVFMLMVFLLPVPRINTMSSLSGAVFVLAAFAYLAQNPYKPGEKRGNGLSARFIPLALLLLAAGTMRPNFAAQGVGTAVLVGILSVIVSPKRETLLQVKYWSKCLGVVLFLFIPWMIVLYRSNGTIALPPFYGWTDPAFLDMSSRLGFWADFKNGLSFLFRFDVLGFLVGICFFVWGNSAGPVAWAAAICTTLLGLYLAYSCSIVIPSETFRYLFPMMLVGFVFIVGTWLNDQARNNRSLFEDIRTIPLIAAFGLLASTQIPSGARELFINVLSIPMEMQTTGPMVQGGKEFFAKLQNTVPPGKKILAVVDFPYLLNYRRNTIYNIDAIGGSSLPPGMPYFQGSGPVRNYLTTLGIDYVIAVKFDKATLMYTRRLWENHNRPEWYFTEVWGMHALDLMDSLDWLHRTGEVLFENDIYRVFRIKKE
jgi:hypothetical protein